METIQVVQQQSVTVPSPISASASEEFMANEEHDIIDEPRTLPSADVHMHKPCLIITESDVLQSVMVQQTIPRPRLQTLPHHFLMMWAPYRASESDAATNT